MVGSLLDFKHPGLVRDRNSLLQDVLGDAVKPFESAKAVKSDVAKLLEEKGEGKIRWADFAPLVNIQTSGTVKPFEPYDYQINLVDTIEANRNIVICKSRQMGISECICSWLLMRAVTEPGFSAVVFSKTGEDASELGSRIRDMAVSLGPLCPVFDSDNKRLVSFKGLGKIYFLPVTARSARSLPSVSVVLFDEAGFIDGIDGVYQGAMPTLSMLGDRGKVIFNSTPNGKSGLFWRLLAAGVGEAKRVASESGVIRLAGENNIVAFDRLEKHTRFWAHKGWAKVLLHWRVHPIYGADPEWAEKTREDRKLTESQWNQEYELDFGLGSNLVFNLEHVERAKRGSWQDAPLWGHKYMVSIDPSFGGEDNFNVHVWDITATPISLAAEFRENYKGKDYYLQKTYELTDLFEPVLLAIEVNSGGKLYAQQIVLDRPNLRVEEVSHTNISKLTHTDRLVLMMEPKREEIEFPEDSALATELEHFIEEHHGKSRIRHAESGHTDDSVMAAAVMAAWLDVARTLNNSYYSAGSTDDRPVSSILDAL